MIDVTADETNFNSLSLDDLIRRGTSTTCT